MDERRMVSELAAIVEAESPSSETTATSACADVVASIGTELLGAPPERLLSDGRTHLRWTFGRPRVAIVGHLDTVWPLGTTARWPFRRDGDVATGPGAFDMKAGIVQGLHALAMLDELEGVAVLVTSDEEIGSPSSRDLIEDLARTARACLVLEPSAGGALKTARKGVSGYTVEVTGRAAHAGLEPEKGVNALVELAAQVPRIVAVARDGTTVTPTLASAGTAVNTVPAHAQVHVDVRASTREEQERADRELRALRAVTDGASVTVSGGINRPPLEASASDALFARAARVAERLGMARLRGVAVGGGSDGNYTAGAGCATLDGLGAVGDGAHAEGEHVVVPAMTERAKLVSELTRELLQERP